MGQVQTVTCGISALERHASILQGPPNVDPITYLETARPTRAGPHPDHGRPGCTSDSFQGYDRDE